MKLSNKIITVPAKLSKGAIAGIVAAVIVVGGCVVAYAYGQLNDEPLPDTNGQEVIEEMENLKDESVGLIVNDIPSDIPWAEYGYDSLESYWADVEAMREEASGMTDAVLSQYGNIFDDTELEQLRAAEEKMVNAVLMSDYDDALSAFNDIVEANKPKPVVNSGSSGGGNYSGSVSSGGYDIPYNFKQMGVLHDDDYRYTWYSSQTLYHYKTPEWTVGSDGIYRDANGRVVVASDDYAEGTVVQSDLFGECVVLDCGVGSSGTLDVYCAW